jgi:hypothetical protein
MPLTPFDLHIDDDQAHRVGVQFDLASVFHPPILF